MVLPGCSEIGLFGCNFVVYNLNLPVTWHRKLLLGRDFGAVNVQMRPERNKFLIKPCFHFIVVTTPQAIDILKCTCL